MCGFICGFIVGLFLLNLLNINWRIGLTIVPITFSNAAIYISLYISILYALLLCKKIFLPWLCRKQELSADRLAISKLQSTEGAFKLLNRIASQEKSMEAQSFWKSLCTKLYAFHPTVKTRQEKLQHWAISHTS